MRSLHFLCLAMSVAGTAAAEPSYWRVTGVASDDTLNVRQGPSASSADIGDVPHDARGIEVGATDASGDWGRINWQEGDGWLAMRFLAPDPQPLIAGTELPQGLLCAGTEPFWSVRFSARSAVFEDMASTGDMLTLARSFTPVARGPFPVMMSHRTPESGSLAVIEPRDCSDGMSDLTYPWRILYLFSNADGDRLLDGCCRLPLDVGQN